jgi:citrate synthase
LPESESLRQLTARQAAARLGVKLETIYAYVSRGRLERELSADGRTSVFDARSVERLAGKRRGGVKTGGLSVVLGSALTLIEPECVRYRGLPAAELSSTAAFEDVAAWLLLGESPPGSNAQTSRSWTPWKASTEALNVARDAQRSLPEGTSTADRLRAIASSVGPTDPFRFDLTPRAVLATTSRLVSAMVDGLPSVAPAPDTALRIGASGVREDSLAGRLWCRLTDHPATREALGCLNAALVLTADHGLAASTLAARVAASVRADPYSVVSVGLGTMSGPLHGAASAPVHRLFQEVERPERATAVFGEFMRRKSRIPGFGHVIYKDWDPRATSLLEKLRGAGADPVRVEVVERMLELLLGSCKVKPNIDLAIGALTYIFGMRERAGETIFGVARSAGWVAHALEEYEEPELRFRPRAHYTGPRAED